MEDTRNTNTLNIPAEQSIGCQSWRMMGISFQEKGELEKARKCFQQALELDANTPKNHRSLAIICHKLEQYTDAVMSYQHTLRFSPNDAVIHTNLGLALHQLGQTEAALFHCKKALVLQPDLEPAYNNLGLIHFSLGQFDEAGAYCLEVININPNNPKPYMNLGMMYTTVGRFQEAITAYETFLTLVPASADIIFRLGRLYQDQGQMDKAIASYEKATNINPNAIEVYLQWSSLLKSLEKPAEAGQLVQKALSIKPEDAESFYHLGLLLKDLKQTQSALNCFRNALKLKPDFEAVTRELGTMLQNAGQTQDALTNYQSALKAKPSDGLRIKFATALPRIYNSKEEISFWRQRFLDQIIELQKQPLKVSDPVSEIGVSTFYLAYQGLDDKEVNREYNKLLAQFRLYDTIPKPKNKKPRIGFISRFFSKHHSVGHVFLGVLEHLSRELFDVVIITIDSAEPLPINSPYKQVHLPPQNLAYACKAIREESLDVLFFADVGGMDPLTYFLATNRLAPIQCSSWGYPETTGIDTIDYYVSSRLFEEKDAEKHYTEKLVLLDTIPAYYKRPKLSENPYKREHFGFKPDEHIYLCPQSLFKIHPDMDTIFGSILEADPKGILVLTNAQYPEWGKLILNRFQHTIPNALSRIKILSAMSFEEFLSLLSVADVMLDTLHFGGGCTTYQALSLGTPVITLPSSFLRGRMAYACYQKMGILDCVADSPEGYAALAVKLGTESTLRDSISRRIQESSDVLFEDETAVRELEAFFNTVLGRMV
jgi:protein O-GlcNAc transferase